jgi:hypothetical protein
MKERPGVRRGMAVPDPRHISKEEMKARTAQAGKKLIE